MMTILATCSNICSLNVTCTFSPFFIVFKSCQTSQRFFSSGFTHPPPPPSPLWEQQQSSSSGRCQASVTVQDSLRMIDFWPTCVFRNDQLSVVLQPALPPTRHHHYILWLQHPETKSLCSDLQCIIWFVFG